MIVMELLHCEGGFVGKSISYMDRSVVATAFQTNFFIDYRFFISSLDIRVLEEQMFGCSWPLTIHT